MWSLNRGVAQAGLTVFIGDLLESLENREYLLKDRREIWIHKTNKEIVKLEIEMWNWL